MAWVLSYLPRGREGWDSLPPPPRDEVFTILFFFYITIGLMLKLWMLFLVFKLEKHKFNFINQTDGLACYENISIINITEKFQQIW